MLAALPVRLYPSSLDIAHIISPMKIQLIAYVPVCCFRSVRPRQGPEPSPKLHASDSDPNVHFRFDSLLSYIRASKDCTDRLRLFQTPYEYKKHQSLKPRVSQNYFGKHHKRYRSHLTLCLQAGGRLLVHDTKFGNSGHSSTLLRVGTLKNCSLCAIVLAASSQFLLDKGLSLSPTLVSDGFARWSVVIPTAHPSTTPINRGNKA